MACSSVQAAGSAPWQTPYENEHSPGPQTPDPSPQTPRSMIVHFCVDAEASHMPVALASMLAKYNRELLMERFKAYFTAHLPHVAPTAGYGQDAGRFWRELQPELGRLKLDPRLLRRLA